MKLDAHREAERLVASVKIGTRSLQQDIEATLRRFERQGRSSTKLVVDTARAHRKAMCTSRDYAAETDHIKPRDPTWPGVAAQRVELARVVGQTGCDLDRALQQLAELDIARALEINNGCGTSQSCEHGGNR